MNSRIFVRFTWGAVHCWPGAPLRREYLKYPHRHIFNVEVATSVSHDDREIEFHDLIDEATALMPGRDWGALSCEHVARMLGQQLANKYKRRFEVTISEDNEAGATVEVEPERVG